MNATRLIDTLEELSSAEDFLQFFGINYDPHIVHVNRLHILQRFHDYLSKQDTLPAEDEALQQVYRQLLQSAYNDFVHSDALTEKVFKVFHMHQPQETFLPLDKLFK